MRGYRRRPSASHRNWYEISRRRCCAGSVVLVLTDRGQQRGHQGRFASAFVRVEHKPIAVWGLDVERFELRQRIVFLDLDVRVLFS